MRFRVSLIAASCALFFSESAFADLPTDDDHVLPCRPTIACTAEITPPGTFEIEAGVIARKFPNPNRQFSMPFLMKLSLEKWVQLQLGDNGYTHGTGNARTSYFDNVQDGPKFHLADQDGRRLATLARAVPATVCQMKIGLRFHKTPSRVT